MLVRDYLDKEVEEGRVFKGTIENFQACFGSGIALLTVGGHAIACENPPTVRALDGAFGNVIQPGHAVNKKPFIGKEIYYKMDDMGLILERFACGDDPNLDEEYTEGMQLVDHEEG